MQDKRESAGALSGSRPSDQAQGLGGSRFDPARLADRVRCGEIKALSIKQPYPHHIFHSGKDVENRDWPTRGRGWVIVHAGKSKSEIDEDDPQDLPLGGVVGMMRITDCVEQMESEWFFGRYGFVIGEAFPITLIPCKGQLGFFALDDETRAAVADAIAMEARQGRDRETRLGSWVAGIAPKPIANLKAQTNDHSPWEQS